MRVNKLIFYVLQVVRGSCTKCTKHQSHQTLSSPMSIHLSLCPSSPMNVYSPMPVQSRVRLVLCLHYPYSCLNVPIHAVKLVLCNKQPYALFTVCLFVCLFFFFFFFNESTTYHRPAHLSFQFYAVPFCLPVVWFNLFTRPMHIAIEHTYMLASRYTYGKHYDPYMRILV